MGLSVEDSFEPKGSFGAGDGGDLGDFFRIYEPEIKSTIDTISGDKEFFYHATRKGSPVDDDEVVLLIGAHAHALLVAYHEATRAQDAQDATWANLSWMSHAIATSHIRAMRDGAPPVDRVADAILTQLVRTAIGRLPQDAQFANLGLKDWNGRRIWLYYLWTAG